MTSKENIELLAPAGTIEAFHAAIDGGCDAIYLGFGDFNARQRQKGFSAQTLSYLIPYAQGLGKKVYVTLNTLVKDGEIPKFVELCNQLYVLKPDAVIVQDLGMAAIIRRFFPKIVLHGSTQMAIHNSQGFEAAKDLGISRVVPARELTLQEIRKINNTTDLEIELFVHGALCYSLSGNCLASSFLGGMSGNRGRCTQVCRRKFQEGPRSGFYFSPKDFQALSYVDEYKKIGISSLKIEGRMRSSSYVYAVTEAYRKFIDGNISFEEAGEALLYDYGRDKCSFLLGGEDSRGIVSAAKTPGTGLFAGKVVARVGEDIVVEGGSFEMVAGDAVRFQPYSGAEGVSGKVSSLEKEDSGMIRARVSGFQKATELEGELFIITRDSKRVKKWRHTQVDVTPRFIGKKMHVTSGKVMSTLDRPKKELTDRLYLRFDSPEWLEFCNKKSAHKIILNLNEATASQFSIKSYLSKFGANIILALPPFIPEGKVSFWKKEIKRLKGEGCHNWMAGHFSQKEFFTKEDTLYADYTVWTMNRASEHLLEDMGFSYFSYSPEDDILNLKRIASERGLFPVFMRIPLFISRVPSPVQDGRELSDGEKNRFLVKKSDGLSMLVSEEPLSLIHRTKKMNEMGISNFVIDFSYYDVDPQFFSRLMASWKRRMRVDGSLYNHKRGLK